MTSTRADEARDITDTEGKELTSARADEAQLTAVSLPQADEAIDDTSDAYTDTVKNALRTPHLNDIHSPSSIAPLHPHRLWPVHPE